MRCYYFAISIFKSQLQRYKSLTDFVVLNCYSDVFIKVYYCINMIPKFTWNSEKDRTEMWLILVWSADIENRLLLRIGMSRVTFQSSFYFMYAIYWIGNMCIYTLSWNGSVIIKTAQWKCMKMLKIKYITCNNSG